VRRTRRRFLKALQTNPAHMPPSGGFRFQKSRSRCILFHSMREKLSGLLRAPWFIAVVALLLRLAWLIYKIRGVSVEVLATLPFQNEVGNVAYALSTGHGFCCLFRQPTGPTAWLAPVYPLLIAGIFKLFGAFTFQSFLASVVLNSLGSAMTCFPLFHAAERVAGKSSAVLATWLWAVSPIAIILPYAWIWDSSLAAFLAAAILWATLCLVDCGSLRDFAAYGLLWGISLLTNPALAALLPFLLAWLLLHKSTGHPPCHPERGFGAKDLNLSRTTLLCGVLVSLTLVLCTCLPWTLRNYSHFDRFIPLRSNLPYEFWSGNNEIFDPSSRAVNRITRYEQTALYAREGETAFLSEKWRAARSFVQTHPRLYAQLCVQRFVATWFGSDSPVHDFVHTDEALAKVLLIWNAASFAAMLIGLFRLYLHRRTYFFPIAVFPAICPITFYLAHTSLRHRHPIDPAICLLIAIAFLGRNESRKVES
jgi:Dolichyl-phosphate-mannose-protein mannosyltransferase